MDQLNPGHLNWGIKNKFYNRLNGIKFKQPELKTILSLGGACDFKDTVSDGEKRQIFIKSAAGFVNQFNFDGVDIDATHSAINKNDLTKLIKELRKATVGKMITISVSSDQESFSSDFDVPTIAKIINFVNILTLKNDVKQSNSIIAEESAISNTFDAMYNWVSNGLSKDKLLIGMSILGNNKNASAALDVTVDSTHSVDAYVHVKNKWMKENGFGGAFLRSFGHTISDGHCLSEVSMNQADPFCCFPVQDVEISNNDLAGVSGQASECCEICSGIGGCVAWTWDNRLGGTCWLKTVAGPGVTKVGAITGIPCEAAPKEGKKQR
uniref:GH18 domain-containing protein n=1 Tax=Panagrolaimus davidi TaxID=227884 RepID=A0A914PPW6_9BILA